MDRRKISPWLYMLLFIFVISLHLTLAPHTNVQANAPQENFYGSDGEKEDESDAPPLAAQLEELAENSYGSYGIYLNILDTGERYGYAENETFYAASLYKLFLVMYIYESAARGTVDLGRTITYEAGDVEGEEGVIQNMPLGTAFTTRELCKYAIVHSDNVAARMLKRIYGYHAFRDYARSIGCPVAGTYNINSTTAREMGILLMRVLQFAATNPLGREVIGYLEESTANSGIPAGLPDAVEVGNKTGYYQGAVNDAAIVFSGDLTYVLCVLSKNSAGYGVHAQASRLVYEDISRRYYEGGASSTRAYQPSTQWFFAEVCTVQRFETWLCIINPDKRTAVAVVKCMGGQVGENEERISVPPESKMTLRVNQMFGMDRDISLCVTCDLPVLAESATYYKHKGDRMIGSSKAGCNQTAMEWYISGGSTHEGVNAWLHLVNPGTVEAHCSVTAMTGGAQPISLSAVLPAQSRESLLLNDLIGNDTGIAIIVLSDAPILVDKSLYLK